MLDRARDDVIALALQREEYALERKVVGLAAAAGEDDLIRSAAKQRGRLAARPFKRDLGGRGGPMAA